MVSQAPATSSMYMGIIVCRSLDVSECCQHKILCVMGVHRDSWTIIPVCNCVKSFI